MRGTPRLAAWLVIMALSAARCGNGGEGSWPRWGMGSRSTAAALPTAAFARPEATPPVALVDTLRLTVSGGARFSPATLTVAAGTTIVFQWVSGTHDINPFGSLSFTASLPESAPHAESVTLSTPGTYQFFCSVHGSESEGMRGTIVVQ